MCFRLSALLQVDADGLDPADGRVGVTEKR